MAIETISVLLRAWGESGETVPEGAFFDKLVNLPGDVDRTTAPWRSANVNLLALALSDFSGADEPSEAFAEELRKRLIDAAQWLEKQPPSLFDALRQQGFGTDVFIDAWINSDQIDLDLPPELLRECAERGLKISLITND